MSDFTSGFIIASVLCLGLALAGSITFAGLYLLRKQPR